MNESQSGNAPNGSKEVTPRSLSSDRPLGDPGEDRLGYAPFAERLAESLYRLAPREGFVMALYGPWGSGKSTVLGFVEYYLDKMPFDDRPVIVHFNPWWFSGHEGKCSDLGGQGRWLCICTFVFHRSTGS